MVGSFEHGNEASGSIKAIEFLDELLSDSKENPCSIWSINAESVMYATSDWTPSFIHFVYCRFTFETQHMVSYYLMLVIFIYC